MHFAKVRLQKLHFLHFRASLTSCASGQLIIANTSTPIKYSSIIIALPKQNVASAASIVLTCKLLVNGSAISTVSIIKISGVIFTYEIGWQEQEQTVCSKVARKLLLVLQRIGITFNKRIRAQFYKTCIEPHIIYYLPERSYCGSEQKKLGHTI